ncbi:RMD1 family protein [Flagellimonas sp.]|uniref:RMD1 family protein n=1 Tax=Flagellimonas sp. TaxID=2058762 RepID=UPI003B50307F
MKNTIIAFQIADNIDIQGCRKNFSQELLFYDKDELFFRYTEKSYLYMFRYGVICIFNLNANEIEDIKSTLYGFCSGPKFSDNHLEESLEVYTNAQNQKVDFKSVHLTDSDLEKIRLIMLNASQSVALDHYAGVTEQLLEDTRKHTSFLENKGRLDLSGRTLKKYIGKVLNVKNRISENLYIFDSPDITWEDEMLNELNLELKKQFDLKDRYLTISQQLNIVKENLELFKDIMFHKESSRLEWVIIILILVEVVDLFLIKLLK